MKIVQQLPLVPAKCFMGTMPAILVDINRLQKSKIWLCQSHTAIFGWANLIMTCWHANPCSSLPNDEELLKHYSGLGRKWNKVKDIVMADFLLASDNRFYHKYVAQKCLEIWINSLISSIDSNLNNEKRWNITLDNTELFKDLYEAIEYLERLDVSSKTFRNSVLRLTRRVEKVTEGDKKSVRAFPNVKEGNKSKLNVKNRIMNDSVNSKWEIK
jgi:uncharacterized protein (UPF0305 family)